MQQTQTTEQPSQLLIVSDNKEDFTLLGDILQHYFPIQQEQQDKENIKNDNDDLRVMIKNKYYKAQVKMNNLLWKQTQLFRYNQLKEDEQNLQQTKYQNQPNYQTSTQQSQQQNTQQSSTKPILIQQPEKYDLMIMLVNQSQQQIIDFSSLDVLIEKINPDEFVLLINTQNCDQQWKYQEVILEKCNNFIEIVKEDLLKIKQNKPLWSRGALLSNDDQENLQTGVFSVLDRMQTTRWSNMVNIKQQKHNSDIKTKEQQIRNLVVQNNQVKREQNGQPTNIQQQTTNNSYNKDKNKQLSQSSDGQQQQPSQHNNNNHHNHHKHQQQQVNQQQLQSQMLKFEQMMSQMMSFKIQSTQMKDTQRKHKAQQLFSKMFANILDRQQ